MTNKISYKMAAFLRVFTHKMAVWEFCLPDGGVSEFYPQDGGMENLPTRWRQYRVFECFTHKMAV